MSTPLQQQVLTERPSNGLIAPPVPRSLAESGLSPDFVADLILKVLLVHGPHGGRELGAAIRLPFAIIDDLLLTLQQRQFVEVRGVSGLGRAGYTFAVAGPGRDRAQEALAASQYTGPAPISLDQYGEWVRRQGIAGVQVTREELAAGFADVVLGRELLDELGPAVNSAKSMFLHGEPGNGKTIIAEHVAQLLGGSVFVPHAVKVDGHVVIVYDPVVHRPADPATLPALRGVEYDSRFVLVRRPVVLTGGELTLEELDLQFEPHAKIYQAPFQMKANGGVLIVDDFGRQRVPPRELLNRWIVPLERRVDFLMLHTGTKFPVPFDCLVIFATNLDPDDLVEEAFLRRIHYKIHVGAPTRSEFTEIFRRCCAERSIEFRESGVQHLYQHVYGAGIEPRACHPRDILDHLVDSARFLDVQPELSDDLLDRSCRSYFIATARASGGGAHAVLPRWREDAGTL